MPSEMQALALSTRKRVSLSTFSKRNFKFQFIKPENSFSFASILNELQPTEGGSVSGSHTCICEWHVELCSAESVVSACSDFQERVMPVFNAALPEAMAVYEVCKLLLSVFIHTLHSILTFLE